MPDMTIRRVGPGEVVASVPISRAAFAPEFHPLLLHCQRGYDAFIAAHLDPALNTGREFWVAHGAGGRLVGFAEIRRLDGEDLLNHICVSPEWQGRGVGRALIANYAQQAEAAAMILDVFSDEPARRLYAHLGFVPVRDNAWSLRDSATVDAEGRVLACSDAHSLRANMDAYGFGMLEAEGRTIGFPSRSVARLPTPDDLADDGFLASLLRAFPDVRTFAHIGPADEAAPEFKTLRAERMSAPMRVLR